MIPFLPQIAIFAFLAMVIALVARRRVIWSVIRSLIAGIFTFFALIILKPENTWVILGSLLAALGFGVFTAPRRKKKTEADAGQEKSIEDQSVALPVQLDDEEEAAFREWLVAHNLPLDSLPADGAKRLRSQFASG